MTFTRVCPAKINLFLEVTGKLPNGYHELATLFAKIDWADTLTLSVQPATQTEISLTLTGPIGKRLRADESNLVCRAARGFLEHFGLHARMNITLDKQIPTGAGLGGGSSDAAHTLLALCEVFKKDKQELLPLAARLGADVPLFMYEDTFLKGEGIGEKLSPIPANGALPWIVLVYPNAFISTKDVFARFQLPTPPEVQTQLTHFDCLLTHIQAGQPLNTWVPHLFNRLEQYVTQISTPVQEAIDALKQTPAQAVLMSGSGSTVFALTDSQAQAQQIAAQLNRPDWLVRCTRFYTPGL